MLFLSSPPADPNLTEGIRKSVVPIVQLIKSGARSLLIVFVAAMSVLAILHSFSYAKSEDQQAKVAAKQKLNGLIVAFGMAFALLVLFSFLDETLTNWVAQFINQ